MGRRVGGGLGVLPSGPAHPPGIPQGAARRRELSRPRQGRDRAHARAGPSLAVLFHRRRPRGTGRHPGDGLPLGQEADPRHARGGHGALCPSRCSNDARRGLTDGADVLPRELVPRMPDRPRQAGGTGSAIRERHRARHAPVPETGLRGVGPVLRAGAQGRRHGAERDTRHRVPFGKHVRFEGRAFINYSGRGPRQWRPSRTHNLRGRPLTEPWRQALAKSITKPEELAKHLDVDPDAIADVVAEYPMRITPMWMQLIQERGDAFWRQVVPEPEELTDDSPADDPLHEELDSPVPHLVHRYPDRVLFMVTNQCPIYCRFCTRKRLVGKPGFLKQGELERVIEYLRAHTEVRDIILSGGDPLLLPDHLLERILKALRTVPHLEIIRIGTRVPGSLPERITPELCAMIKQYHPLYMNLHFNHPDELTLEVKAACGRLADAGVPLGAQTVLLKGVNDDPSIMMRLVHQLLLARVKPYYLYQADLTRGTNHLRTTVETGLEIIKALQGHTSGMGVPHFVIDAPGGGGKIPLLPSDYLVSLTPEEAILTNYEGKTYIYPQPPQPGGNGKRRELPMVAAPSTATAPSTGCRMADSMLG